jgi:hypothetical protein
VDNFLSRTPGGHQVAFREVNQSGRSHCPRNRPGRAKWGRGLPEGPATAFALLRALFLKTIRKWSILALGANVTAYLWQPPICIDRSACRRRSPRACAEGWSLFLVQLRRLVYSNSRIAASRAWTSSQVGEGPKHSTRHCASNPAAIAFASSGEGNRASLLAKVMSGGGT